MRLSACASRAVAVCCLAVVGLPTLAQSQTAISVDVTANRHAINPLVYGTSNLTTAQMIDLNTPLVRYGGNSASTYNWLINGDNRGADWYFESYGDTSSVAGERGDTFVSNTKTAKAQGMITIPMLQWVAKLGANRTSTRSFSVTKYGSQTGTDPWNSDAGNGISSAAGNPYITGNDPNDSATPNNSTDQIPWVQHLIAKWGMAANGGVKYYIMDNEPSIWHSTHRDYQPVGQKMSELVTDYINYAGGIRQVDPGAQIVGPEEWGWLGYLYSGYDQQYASAHGWNGVFPDSQSHGNMENVAYLLQSLSNYQKAHGTQLLNIFSLHYYPQQGEFSDDDSSGMQAIRNRSTRSLWDTNYVDTSWVNANIQLIPRMKSWVSTYYPGLKTAVTEYSWGDESNLNGATAQADVFGIFGREGLDMGTRWGTPATNSPAYLAMKIWRNYDGHNSGFGTTSCQCSVPNPDNLSAFAAQRSDGTTTVMVINKSASATPINLSIANQGVANWASTWQIKSKTQTSITRLANTTVTNGVISMAVPAQSITLFVVPSGPYHLTYQYDFETGVDGWVAGGAPITGLVSSKNEAFAGTKGLAVKFSGAKGTSSAYVENPGTPAGNTVTFHIWIPANSKISWIQPYVMQGAAGSWTWTGNYQDISALQTNAWNTLTVKVPADAATPLAQLGVQFTTSASWTGNCYIDSISWSP